MVALSLPLSPLLPQLEIQIRLRCDRVWCLYQVPPVNLPNDDVCCLHSLVCIKSLVQRLFCSEHVVPRRDVSLIIQKTLMVMMMIQSCGKAATTNALSSHAGTTNQQQRLGQEMLSREAWEAYMIINFIWCVVLADCRTHRPNGPDDRNICFHQNDGSGSSHRAVWRCGCGAALNINKLIHFIKRNVIVSFVIKIAWCAAPDITNYTLHTWLIKWWTRLVTMIMKWDSR